MKYKTVHIQFIFLVFQKVVPIISLSKSYNMDLTHIVVTYNFNQNMLKSKATMPTTFL